MDQIQTPITFGPKSSPELTWLAFNAVPTISQLSLSWAMPYVPYAGSGVGLFAIPPNNANVLIEFEGLVQQHPSTPPLATGRPSR